jgi:hypothetical protein
MKGLASRLGHAAAVGILLLIAGAIVAPASASTLAPLRSGAEESAPEITVLASDARGVRLAFELPALEVERYDLDRAVFQTVSFRGAELMGEVGEPSLPEFTRLVAIPARAGATVRVLAVEEETLLGYQILPMQDEDETAFAMDLATYSRDEFLGGSPVELAAPALLRQLRVVPITFRPVRYNPLRSELRVLRRVELSVEFAGVDLRNAPGRDRVVVSRDLDQFYRSVVVNYDAGGRPDTWPASTDLGCWLIIARDNATVLQTIQPLIDWRKRMGYQAVLATTTQTGTSPTQIRAYIQNAYNSWEQPPEYVVIVGDVTGSFAIGTFNENYSGCGGEGDHPYVQLDGDDLLPDAFIGRLSAETTDMLDLIVDKILAYESAPYVTDPNWFSRACLVGDPSSSGPTCVHVQQWLKEKLRRLGFTQIDTIFTSPFVSRITSSVNNGVDFCGYRGYYGASGWDPTDVYALNNGQKLPFAVMLTCGTGSFASGTSLNEAWLRGVSGAPYTIKGGIGGIATATICTHTRYNNCFYVGTAYGLYWEGHYKLGRAHARGKLEMVLNYGAYDFSNAARYIWWNNLMGDPATELWTRHPSALTVSYPAVVPLGANRVAISVTAGGLPRAGAWVYLYRGTEIGIGGYTDATGTVELPLYPHQGSFTIAPLALYVGLDTDSIDDGIRSGQGNGDGQASPGERIVPVILLRNYGTQSAEGVTLSLGTSDPYVGVISGGPIDYGTLLPGQSATPQSGALELYLSPVMPAAHVVKLDLTVSSGADSWPAILSLPIVAADLAYRDLTLTGCGAQLDPGETAQLSVSLKNFGALTAPGPITLFLMSDSYSVHVSGADAEIANSLGPGASGTSTPFGIRSPLNCLPGQLAQLRLAITFADGGRDTARFTLPVGTADANDPTGPDAYGYLAFDHTDTAFPQAPVYGWVEINPNGGGAGTDVGLTDNGTNQDNTKTIPLPFPFRFYGVGFDRVSVCSNGYLAMGTSYIAPSQNWYLPSAMGPAYMIAPFWDDLYQSGTGRAYSWFDADQHRFVVAWDNVRHEATGATESFEVILNDPEYYPTATGDGEIIFQYETVQDNDALQMYATAGIQDGEHTTGITYSYFNQRPATAVNLAAGLAVKFTTATIGASGSDPADPVQARVFLLRQNEPNPFGASTAIRFALDRRGPVSLRVYDVNGHLVRTLLQGELAPGEYTMRWTGVNDRNRPAPAGVYFYRLDGADQTRTRKLMLVR